MTDAPTTDLSAPTGGNNRSEKPAVSEIEPGRGPGASPKPPSQVSASKDGSEYTEQQRHPEESKAGAAKEKPTESLNHIGKPSLTLAHGYSETQDDELEAPDSGCNAFELQRRRQERARRGDALDDGTCGEHNHFW